jgi:hypothetical protein
MLAMLLLLMLFGALVIDSFYVAAARVQQENATDAAALAAAEVLATEALLFADPSLYATANPSSLFANAAQAARDFGAKNFVGGKPLNILPADVSFDIVQIPSRAIVGSQSADPTVASALTPTQRRSINAVQVVGRRTKGRGSPLTLPLFNGIGYQMTTRSEAVLDGYVYGFTPYVMGFDPTASPPLETAVTPSNPIAEGLNIPLVPLAIFSDPTGSSPQSWESQVESSVDFTSPNALAYGTMTITIGNANFSAAQLYNGGTLNATFLAIGTNYTTNPPNKYMSDGTNRTINDQILNGSGIAPADYFAFYTGNGNLPLALNRTTDPPGPLVCPGTPVGPFPDTADFATLAGSLASLRNVPMVWPLFTGYDASIPPKVIVSGFVVARVSGVQPMTVAGQTCLQVQLTPSLRATKTALTYVSQWPTTQPAPSAYFPFRFPNAYVKRIRLMR